MKHKDDKHAAQNVFPLNVHAKNFTNDSVNENPVKGKELIQENDFTKKAEELLAPYYDEFHFANYE